MAHRSSLLRNLFLWRLVPLVLIVLSTTALGSFFISVPKAHALALATSDYTIPVGSDPWGTAFDSKGNVWVAVPDCDPSPQCPTSTPPGQLEEFNPTTSSWISTYQLPSGYAQPLFLAFDAQGNVWFAMPMDNSIGKYNPGNNTFQQWAVPTASAGPWDVAVDQNGKIWFTEHYANKIGRFDPVSQTFLEIATPASNSQPYGITVDKSNNIWFTENNSSVALIAEYTTGGQLLEYKIRNTLPGGSLTPHLITVDSNGNIWWSEGWVGMVGELQISQAQPGTNAGVKEYSYPAYCNWCGTHTSGISIDGNGLIWFDDSVQGTYGSFPASGTGSVSLFSAPSNHPHDGLRVDAQNRVWFDEEFGNRLAEAIQVANPPPTTLGTLVAQDTFQRPNQTLWGTASDGNTWGGDAGGNAIFSIQSNAGQVANGAGIYTGTLGSTITDGQVSFTGSTSSFNSTDFGAVLRFHDSNNWYKAYIDGTQLRIRRDQNGNNVVIASTPFPATAGTSYSLKFQAVGSSLAASVWPTSGTQPSNWMLSTADSTFSSGYAGLQVYEQAANTVTYTSFNTYTVTSGTATPSPTTTVTPAATPSPTTVVTPVATPSPTTVVTPVATPSGAVIAQDTFQRPNQTLWGTASDGNTWGGDANNNTAFSITNNAGQIANGNASLSGILGPSATDSQVLFTGSMSAFSSTNLGAVLRFTDTNNWYKAYIDGTNLTLQKKVSGSTTILANVPFAATGGTSYTLRFQIVGTTLSAKVWATSGTEPANWMATATDSALASGYCGLRAQISSGVSATYTSFTAYSLSSSTPTPTPGSTPSPTPSPISSPTSTLTPGTILAQDTFQRANQTYWGTASDGNTWGADANTNTVFSIAANAGTIANGNTSYSAILGPTASNAQVLFTGSMSSFSGTNLGAVLRFTDTNNWYKAYIDGTNLILQKKVNGSTTILASVPFAATGGTSYTLRFQIVGTTLSAKVWATSGTEPANWMATATDSTFQSGYCGLRALVQNGATASYTSFTATSQ